MYRDRLREIDENRLIFDDLRNVMLGYKADLISVDPPFSISSAE